MWCTSRGDALHAHPTRGHKLQSTIRSDGSPPHCLVSVFSPRAITKLSENLQELTRSMIFDCFFVIKEIKLFLALNGFISVGKDVMMTCFCSDTRIGPMNRGQMTRLGWSSLAGRRRLQLRG